MTDLMIELTSLEKFAVYEVVVRPYTIAIGPEESVTVRTNSDLDGIKILELIPLVGNELPLIQICVYTLYLNICKYITQSCVVFLFLFSEIYIPQ